MELDNDKKITTLYVRMEILRFAKDNKINLSEWLNTEFADKFLSLNSKIIRLKEIKQEEEDIIKDIELLKERSEVLEKSLTVAEKRYITQAKDKLRKGFALVAMKNFFNEEFKRKYSLDEFRSLIDFYEAQAEKRLSYVLSKKKN